MDCMLQLFKAKLLPKSMVEVTNITLIKQKKLCCFFSGHLCVIFDFVVVRQQNPPAVNVVTLYFTDVIFRRKTLLKPAGELVFYQKNCHI